MHRPHRIYPFFQKNRFFNYAGETYEGFLHSLLLIAESLRNKALGLRRIRRDWVNHYIELVPYDLSIPYTSPHPRVTWLGHSTFLIQVSGFNLITDPMFGNPSSLFRRLVKPVILPEQVPPIDVILISHNHLDHMNAESLYVLARKNSRVKILVPLGDKAWFDRRGFTHVEEYTWWESLTLDKFDSKLTFTFLPAHHWSGRGIFDRNKSLWGSWMIQSSEHNLYFAGDTAYARHFKAIATEFGRIDTALMPIGPCEPHEDMGVTHMNAEQAGQAFIELGAQRFIPCHWGTLWFGTDYPLLPVERLQAWWQKNLGVVKAAQLDILKFGQTITCYPLQDQIVLDATPTKNITV
jgi:L-ascorbate metabolism protein UlaG (beta-lactamase superfamily)